MRDGLSFKYFCYNIDSKDYKKNKNYKNINKINKKINNDITENVTKKQKQWKYDQ